jgi:hypothetical protein
MFDIGLLLETFEERSGIFLLCLTNRKYWQTHPDDTSHCPTMHQNTLFCRINHVGVQIKVKINIYLPSLFLLSGQSSHVFPLDLAS